MSTVFYGWRVPQSRWDDVLVYLKECYAAHPMLSGFTNERNVRDLAIRTEWDVKASWEHWQSFIPHITVEAQLFRDDDSFVFRLVGDQILIFDHFSNANKLGKKIPGFRRCWYDGRVGEGSGAKDKAFICKRMDEMILARQYFLVPLIDRFVVTQVLLNYHNAVRIERERLRKENMSDDDTTNISMDDLF